jgi:hypothetical protein
MILVKELKLKNEKSTVRPGRHVLTGMREAD